MNTKFIILSFAAGIVIAGCLSGCWTFVGYGLGAWADNGAAHDTVPIFRDISSYTGQAALIKYSDTVHYATFENYSNEPYEHYKKYYDHYAEIHPIKPEVIKFGDSVVIDGYEYMGKFAGYFPRGILLNEGKLFFWDFDAIIKPRYFTKEELLWHFESNAIPIRGTLNFHDKSNDFSLTNRDFENVYILPHSAPGRWIGLAIGAAADITLWGLFVYYLSPAHGGQGSFAKVHYVGSIP